jgi:proteasome alpha subunit
MGAIGHPGDIERLRMAAIELASTEGFTRSATDVSLRRLAHYSLSPVMKNAFEQVYGAPFLARLLFAEVGAQPEDDLFLRVEYDGAIATNSQGVSPTRRGFAALAATKAAAELMESLLEKEHTADADLEKTVDLALNAWTIGHMAMGEDGVRELPEPAAIAKCRQEQLAEMGVEAAILERAGKTAIRYRALSDKEVRSAIRG